MPTKFTDFIHDFENDPDVKAGVEKAEREIRLGAALKLARLAKGFTQAKVQDITGINQADISRIEAGNWGNGPTLDTLIRLSTALGVLVSIPDLRVTSQSKSAMTPEREPLARATRMRGAGGLTM